jgi:uncharacterized protein YjbJ (UPF0337 family)
MSNIRLTAISLLLLTATALVACDRGHESGAEQKTVGHIESAAGELTGSDKLKSAGRHDEVVGGVKTVAGDVKDTVKDATKR